MLCNSRPARKIHTRTARRAVGLTTLAVALTSLLAPTACVADPVHRASARRLIAAAAAAEPIAKPIAKRTSPLLALRGENGISRGVERIELKISEEARTLVVDLMGPSSRRVLVTYVATYEGKRIATASKTVTLVEGAKTARFQLSAEVARVASISVNAKFAKGAPKHRRRCGSICG